MAGEIETILDKTGKVTEIEKEAHLHILKQICYHRQYLDIEDLWDSYNSVMKEIELGKASWNIALADKIHQFCEFRSNLIAREAIAKQMSVQSKQMGPGRKAKDQEDRVFYCSEFNQRSGCAHADHHEGRFNNKVVYKWHICRRCFRESGEKKFHNENDANCPKRSQ